MFKLSNKIALVTGGGSGIGAAICEAFSAAGAKLIVVDRDVANGEAMARKVSGQFRSLDVSNEAGCEALAREIGRVDILVNNAGIGHVGTILQTNASDLDRLYNVNVKGVFNLAKAFLPAMLEHKNGVIVNLASIG